MDRVTSAQTIELQVDEQRDQLSNFIAEQVAVFEAPIKEERAATAFEEQFRDSLTTIASNTNETTERVEAANQLLETLDRAELDPATLVSQATAQQLDLVPATVTLEASEAALTVAQEIREQPVSSTAETREAVQQQVIAELKGNDANRYAQLQTNIETAQEKFQSTLHAVDEKVAQLNLARADLTKEATLQEFTEISRPVAIQINDYLRDTVDREGLPAILDPERFEEHVQQVANVIVETARNNGITLGATRESAQEVNQVASTLFNTLSSGMERANSEHALSHQITHTYDVASTLQARILTNS